VTLLGENGDIAIATVASGLPDGSRVLELPSTEVRDSLHHWGAAPLPPYIRTPLPFEQEDRYQTVYAKRAGSAAAPTAGLHFTPQLLTELSAMGIETARVTLNVGVGTFRPVRTETIEEHEMHSESAEMPTETAEKINRHSGRVIAVGTTSVRTLETAACIEPNDEQSRRVRAFSGETSLFITPGYRFRVVDAMLTNFHLPRSTLLMLVSAFAGIESTRTAYAAAIENKYRFFSFGDAMLII